MSYVLVSIEARKVTVDVEACFRKRSEWYLLEKDVTQTVLPNVMLKFVFIVHGNALI